MRQNQVGYRVDMLPGLLLVYKVYETYCKRGGPHHARLERYISAGVYLWKSYATYTSAQ